MTQFLLNYLLDYLNKSGPWIEIEWSAPCSAFHRLGHSHVSRHFLWHFAFKDWYVDILALQYE